MRVASDRHERPSSPNSLRVAVALVGMMVIWTLSAFAQESETATGPLRFEPYPDVFPFSVRSRKDDLFFYPCSQCHKFMESSAEIRKLRAPHKVELNHGRGRLWCITCHSLEQRDYLATLLQEQVDFDDAYLLCGSCHAAKQKDWFYGAHGKRTANWAGDRELYNCTDCHDAHSPAIPPRAPQPPPPVRAGLERGVGEKHMAHQPWELMPEHPKEEADPVED